MNRNKSDKYLKVRQSFSMRMLLLGLVVLGVQSANAATAYAKLPLPSTPANSQAVAGNQQVTVTWNASAYAAGYDVCMATVAMSGDVTQCTRFKGGRWLLDKASPLVVTGLSNGTAYHFRIVAKNATGRSAGSADIAVTPTNVVPPTPTGKLNDTGITTCSTDTSDGLPCPQLKYPHQDGDNGRDVTANDNRDGYAGFSYTKLDAKGVPLPDQSVSYATQPWTCVKDNVTGLIWEVRTDNGGLHDKDWSYTWYEPDNTKNGGYAGKQNGGVCGGTSRCDTQGFVQAVNAAGWCGAKDWRMPTVNELFSLVQVYRYQVPVMTIPMIDADFFPNTASATLPHRLVLYWSSSPFVVASSAWGVDFSSYDFQGGAKNDALQVRLVRGGQ